MGEMRAIAPAMFKPYAWDLSSDGQRFLVNVPVIKSSSVPLSLVMNWAATLNR